MNNKSPLLIIIGVVLAIVLFNSVFLVYQWEKAIKLRFGEIIASDYEPGIHFKWPLVNTIRKFDARLRTLDARPERFLTLEKKDVIVDSYVKWRIANVAQYYRSTGGNADKTSRLLAERINTALRNEFGKRTIQEVVSGERQEIMDLLTKDADVQANDLGVEVLDVRVKQIDLPTEVSESVYGRMSAERERVARDLRA
ncbi:MAG TPA: protease modulator HflC, partial [Chromatiaceae bacterium]|nr:protease modulator HflC [Chromatiaceae bacterium]